MLQNIVLLPGVLSLVSLLPAGAATLFASSTFDSGLEGWGGGASPTVISGSDPFLQISAGASSLATHNSSPDWTGNFADAGINGVTLSLMGPAANPGPLAIRATLLGPGNVTRWVTEPAAVPADDLWRNVIFSFDESSMTRIAGTGSFAETLSSVNRVLFRHDPGTPDQMGDPVTGSLGLDNIRTVPEPATGALLGASLGMALLRRQRQPPYRPTARR